VTNRILNAVVEDAASTLEKFSSSRAEYATLDGNSQIEGERQAEPASLSAIAAGFARCNVVLTCLSAKSDGLAEIERKEMYTGSLVALTTVYKVR